MHLCLCLSPPHVGLVWEGEMDNQSCWLVDKFVVVAVVVVVSAGPEG